MSQARPFVPAIKATAVPAPRIRTSRKRELETLHTHYQRLAALSKAQHDLFSSHSVDEAERRHRIKAVEVEKAG